jgi:hypothetical protein
MAPTCEKNVQIKLTPKNFLLIIFNVVYIGAVAIIPKLLLATCCDCEIYIIKTQKVREKV